MKYKEESCWDCGRMWRIEEDEELIECICQMTPIVEKKEVGK